MKYISRLLLISSLFGIAIGCLPGLGLGGGGGGCCSAAQPACGNPCGGAGGAAPAPVYAAAPLAPAPFASYPQAPAAPHQPASFQQQQFGGANAFQPQQPQQFQQIQGGYAGASQGGNYGSIQTGAVSAGGAYLSEPVHQVQPLPLLGQPVAYEKTVVAPTQQVLNTAQVLTKVMPASAVLDENVVEPAVASPNNMVTSINTQTSYGDEQQTQTQVHQTQPQQHVLNRPAASSSSSSSSASSSAEHHATHQVRVPSSSSSIESNEQRVVPESIIVKEIVQSFETTTPYPKQVALQTIAPFVPQSVQTVRPVPQPIQTVHPQVTQPQVSQPHPVPQQVNYLAPHVPSVTQHVVDTVQPVVQPIQPAPIQPAPLPTAHNVQVSVAETTEAPARFVPETKVVPEEERIEATGGSDYDQPSNVPSNIPSNEQATVNELLASLDTATSTPASNLDFNQVTIEPNPNQKPSIIETEGDDYDAPLNEDRKDVPTSEPTRNVAPSNPEPVAVVPEETAPIIPQPIQPIQTYQPQVTSAPVAETTVGYVEPPKAEPEIHLQPVVPAVRVEMTTPEPTPTIRFELPIEVHEVVTPQVPLQPEPAVIQTITEEPIVEVTAQVLETSAAPVSQFFENITSREETKEETAPTQPEPSVPAQTTNGNDYDEEKSVENKVSTETEVVPNLGEYGSKFAKVQGAETKQVSEPIQIETIENENPYGRRYWIF